MLLIGKESNLVNIDIKIEHQRPSTKRNIVVRGVLGDSASVDFNGLVIIDQGSKLSNAWLAAHLLLLSDKARGRAVPSLEILENDIKAGHATTVGKVDENEIFYLMSRGFTRQKAKEVIIQGFLGGFLNEFPDVPKKEKVLETLKYAI
jgi:Fe-S cluster assembly protein SufD